MTWSEVKLAALQTMFSNEGAVLTPDDINQEYINAMPAKANEALQQVASVGRPILKSWQVEMAQAEAGAARRGQGVQDQPAAVPAPLPVHPPGAGAV